MSELMTVQVERPDEAALKRGAEDAIALVRDFAIDSPTMYEVAADELRAIKARAAKLDEQRKAITRPLDDAKKAAMDLFRGPLEVLAEAESLLKSKMLDWQRAQDRIAREEQAKIEAATRAERERLAAEADRLTAAGKVEEAAAKRDVASIMVAPAVAPQADVPKVQGVATRKTVDFEVVDFAALVAFVATRPDLLGVLSVDTVKLRALVRALGADANLPGVRVFEKASISAARR